MVSVGRGGRRAAPGTGNCHAKGSSHFGMRLHGRRMRFGFGCAQIRHADNDVAIRVRAGRRRGENLDRTDLQDAVRTRGPGDRPDGDLRAQGLQTGDRAGETGTAGGHAHRFRRQHGSCAPDLHTQPGLCGTRESRTSAATGAAPAGAARDHLIRRARARSGRASPAAGTGARASPEFIVALAARAQSADPGSLNAFERRLQGSRQGLTWPNLTPYRPFRTSPPIGAGA
jgi:hypothetical protein